MDNHHLKQESIDMTEENIKRIAALFPNCVTEAKDENGRLKHVVNFELLKQMLSPDVVDGAEHYEFTWVGKKAAIVEANKPIRKTLRPCVEESKNWDTTENLYIEGDNLEVLKLLQENYLGKVKMIYIDPPYNTGNDFVYRDNFTRSQEEENAQMGMYDENDNHLFKNTDTNGRFHSDWCSMIYSRLMLARNLLAEDGVIFISIDDNEVENLRKICDEVFGGQNFVAQCVRKRRNSQANLSKNISPIHEYMLIYARQQGDVLNRITANIDLDEFKNPDNDSRGLYKTMPCTNKGGSAYTVVTPTGKAITEEWRFKRDTYDRLLSDGRIVFPRGGEGKPRYKLFLSEKVQEGQLANTWLDTLSSNQEASKEISALFEGVIFDTPKPVGLMKFCVELASKDNSIILDFFSGSATTAHAVMQLNAEDGGHRKFIMVQLPEKCDEKSEAFKAGYKNICEIGKERIRRAGEKIKKEHPEAKGLDVGFRVLNVSDSNMKDVYYAAGEYTQDLLVQTESNIKEDRTDLDLLFGCLLDWGLPLSLPYRSEEIEGCVVHTYNDGDLIACFAEKIPESVVKTIAKRKPLRAVFRDAGFASSPEKINVFEIFKLYAPDTSVKVI